MKEKNRELYIFQRNFMEYEDSEEGMRDNIINTVKISDSEERN